MLRAKYKELLLQDVRGANDLEELKAVVLRLIDGIPTNEDTVEAVRKSLTTSSMK